MTNDTTPATIGADAVREALKWAAAALQAIAPDEDTVRDKATGETRSVGQILDAADAALASAAQPAARRWPSVSGVGRDADHSRVVIVYLADVPTDAELRALHDTVRGGAAAAPTASPARWYMVNAAGMATLCADKQDAEQVAADAQAAWPHVGPHRAVQMVEVAAPPAPAAQVDALPREDFAWLVVQEACDTEPADEDDPECIRILRRDLKSAVLAALLRHGAEAARATKEGGEA